MVVANGSVSREALHSRTVQMQGFRRSDGLFEVEALLLDTKPFDFRPPSDQRVVKVGDSIHELQVRIVFNADMTVQDVIAETIAVPYADCLQGPATLKSLIGLKLSHGWNAEVRKRLGGAASCTHFAALMGPMATTAFHAVAGWRATTLGPVTTTPEGRPILLDSCLAYSHKGTIVRQQWPGYYKP